jgi:nicotinamide-nucleotide amidase
LLVRGGLGPPADDRTAEAVARSAGVPLELRPEALEVIRERFARGNYPLTPNNEKQAWLPRGATLLPNARGTAPGFLLRVRDGRGVDCRVVCLPGGPAELEGIFDEELAPRLRDELSLRPALVRSFNVFGLGESQMDHRLSDLLQACGPTGSVVTSVHYRTSFPENRVVLVVRPGAGGEGEARAVLARLEQAVRDRLGRHVFGVDEESFAGSVVACLREAGASLALAESCTGGQAGDLLTSAPGSSEVFGLGVVSYGNQFKQQVLGVPAEVLARHGAVSRECVEAMAKGVRALAGATFGAAVSGVAGPGGGSPEKPVGTVHFAVAGPEGRVRHLHRLFPFDRPRVKRLAAYTVLALVREECRKEGSTRLDPLEGRWAPRATAGASGEEKS